MKKLFFTLFVVILSLTFVSSVSANPQGKTDSKTTYLNELKKYEKQLQVTEQVPYKEVQLEDGTILFHEIKVNRDIPSVAERNDISATTAAVTATVTYSITSSQGYKNIFGITLYKLDYTTSWTFDYNTVLSSYSYVQTFNGGGWSLKSTNSYGPGINDAGREHQWTGTAQFGIVVGGIDINIETLSNHHRVKYDGTYSWMYEVTS
ncbi:MAG: hypothetical protein H7X86_10615 [Gorillibacterium sp.]|nr:hypothetical protein [Gorillibacterium sp.]